MKRKNAESAIKMIAGSRKRLLVLGLTMLAGSVLVTAAVRAYNRAPLRSGNAAGPSTAVPLVQHVGKPGQSLHTRLSLQPAADRFRRRVGKRFVESGRERSTLVGRLTAGAAQYQVRIVRSQEDDGEQVEISLSGKAGSLTWNGKDGAKSGGRDATSLERALIERLSLDGPDQFILAQTRGASYYTVAENVMPEEAGGSEEYAGPTWDIVRIGEPQGDALNHPKSPWRLYYLNRSTGSIDKIISMEDGETIAAEITGWADRGGERIPIQITWTRNSQVIMEIRFENASFAAR